MTPEAASVDLRDAACGADSIQDLNTLKVASLLGFCVATVLLIPMEIFVWGGLVWAAGLFCCIRQSDRVFRRRMAVLFGCILLLALAPIHTDLSNRHFLELSFFFAAAIVGPYLLLRKSDAGVLDFKFWPERLRRLDVLYTLYSIPLAWGLLKLYFFHFNLDLPSHWPMPESYSSEGYFRLLAGINGVGIWDELFFVNTVFAVLRSILPFRYANMVQAVVYTAVLNDMAFTGIGPLLIYYFALTQGFMYEKSKCLLYVLIVHIVVDYFLVEAIMHYHYPDMLEFARWF